MRGESCRTSTSILDSIENKTRGRSINRT